MSSLICSHSSTGAQFYACKATIVELEATLSKTKENEIASQKQISEAESLIQQLKNELTEVQAEREQSQIAVRTTNYYLKIKLLDLAFFLRFRRAVPISTD